MGTWRVSGLIYGLLVGLVLNAVFLPLFDQGFFGSNPIRVTAPPDIAVALYGTTLAPYSVPVWLEMFLLGIVFGLVLTVLLKIPRASAAGGYEENVAAATTRDIGRREFNKALGGGAIALLGGAVLWYGIKSALAPPPVAQPQLIEGNQATGADGTTGAPADGIQAQVPPTAAPTDVPTQAPTQTPQDTATAVAQGQPGATAAVPQDTATAVPQVEPTAPPSATAQPPTAVAQAPTSTGTPSVFANVKPVLVPEVTSVDNFYITTKNFIDPTVDGNSWKITFKGLADNPYSLTLKDVQALPSVDRIETLACISNPIGGNLIGNARWKGVDFATLVKKAKPRKGVVDVVVRGADGYADSFPLSAALNNECVLVYEQNGKPLAQKHGYPARLLVPGIYGMKNCKWITEVEFVDNDFKGYWESQGWSDTAPYQTMSRIDFPDKSSIDAKPLYVGGVAFAGDRGIKRVEVSTDGGKTWGDAQLRPPLGKYTWTLWTFPWNPKKGSYALQVRATDGKGQVQTSNTTDTYPDGATGYHTVKVRVG